MYTQRCCVWYCSVLSCCCCVLHCLLSLATGFPGRCTCFCWFYVCPFLRVSASRRIVGTAANARLNWPLCIVYGRILIADIITRNLVATSVLACIKSRKFSNVFPSRRLVGVRRFSCLPGVRSQTLLQMTNRGIHPNEETCDKVMLYFLNEGQLSRSLSFAQHSFNQVNRKFESIITSVCLLSPGVARLEAKPFRYIYIFLARWGQPSLSTSNGVGRRKTRTRVVCDASLTAVCVYGVTALMSERGRCCLERPKRFVARVPTVVLVRPH